MMCGGRWEGAEAEAEGEADPTIVGNLIEAD